MVSVHRVMCYIRTTFGRGWLLLLALLLLTIFWPLIAFWSILAFDPVKFSEEWIKTGITSLLLIAIIKVATGIRTFTSSADRDLSQIDACLAYADALRSAVIVRRATLEKPGAAGQPFDVSQNWIRFQTDVSTLPQRLYGQLAKTTISKSLGELNIRRMEAIVNELSQAARLSDLNQDEISGLLQDIDNLKSDLHTIRKQTLQA